MWKAHRRREEHQEGEPLGRVEKNGATMVINGRAVTSTIKEALEERKYGAKVTKHLGLTSSEYEQLDWKAHIRAVKYLNISATTLKFYLRNVTLFCRVQKLKN